MRLRITLLAGLAGVALTGVAGLVQAQQTPVPPSQNGPVAPPPVNTPVAPEAEEPPVLPNAPAPNLTPAPVTAEKPAAEAAKPKSQTPEKPAEPLRRVRAGGAIVQAIDKVTAESLRFEAPIGQPIRYKSLVITVRACETSADDEVTPDSAAYLTIDSQPRPATGRALPPAKQVFKGWMFASSPGINPLQHPVYDVWVIACRASAPVPAKR